ncbi:hypothetical protein AGMMS50262_22120 [Bacteroidia bacterium]|nr:hypothetical protein AGMMS50262_22120 [Bacteroidia bacterium]
MKNKIVLVCRILLGIVFIFSGFVKAVDPWGSAYKIMDYFLAWKLSAFDFAALPLAFAQSAVEFALGVLLLFGVYRKAVTGLILLLMCFMTPLTLYLAITNPITDCGCFGDALVITNWQTFFKNIVLLAMAIIAFIRHKEITPLFSKKARFLTVLYTSIFILAVSFYCYVYLPVLDFRPYKIGNNLVELSQIPEGAATDQYEITFTYEKDGVKQNFTIENYPKGDSTGWKFVDSQSKLIKKGYEPPIHDFTITGENGDDRTEEILSDTSYTFLLIAHKLEQADEAHIDKINEIYDYTQQHGYRFLCLTASLPRQIQEWKESTGAEYPFYTTDDIALKTIIRSNPGLLLLKAGVVINKWADNDIPNTILGQIPENHDKRNILLLLLVLIVPLAVLYIIDYQFIKS